MPLQAKGVAISLRSGGVLSPPVPRQIRGQVGEGILLIGDEPQPYKIASSLTFLAMTGRKLRVTEHTNKHTPLLCRSYQRKILLIEGVKDEASEARGTS